MNRGLLRGLWELELRQARGAARRPGTYLSGGLLLALAVAVQWTTGIGAANPEARPASRASGLGILALLATSAVAAGLIGPVWAVIRREAQWVVTAPGGARALVVWRTARGTVVRFLESALLVVTTQAVRGQRPAFGVALVLAAWYVGYGLASTGVRFGFAALYARAARPWLARLAAALGWAGLVLVLASIPGVLPALGRVAARSDGRAVLDAATWLLAGLGVAAVGILRAEALVVRAVADGDAFQRRARRGVLELAWRTPEPEAFRLRGVGAYGWMALVQARRRLLQQVLSLVVVVAVTLTIAHYAASWTVCVPAVIAAAMLVTSSGVVLPGPAVADGRLLPIPLRTIAIWRIGQGAAGQAGGLLPVWLLAAVLGDTSREVVLVGSTCLLPFCILVAVLLWERVPDLESTGARMQRLGSRAALSVGGAALLVRAWPGAAGAAAAAAWLLLTSMVLARSGVRRLESSLRPAASAGTA